MAIPKFNRVFIGLLLLLAPSAFAHTSPPRAPLFQGSGFRPKCEHLLGPPGKVYPSEEARLPGPHFFVAADRSVAKRPLASMDRLRVTAYNVENVIERDGAYSPHGYGKSVYQYGELTKGSRQCEGMLATIRFENPDILIGVEIQSLHALDAATRGEIFKDFLVILVPSNDSNRNIAILVRKDLPFDIEVQSHRDLVHEYFGEDDPAFTRDFPMAFFRPMGAPNDSAPLFAVGGVHFKSQFDSTPTEGQVDVKSRIKRGNEVESMLQVIAGYERRWPGMRFIIGGDFNADLERATELDRLRRTRFLRNAFDAAGMPPGLARATHSMYFEGNFVETPLDGIYTDPLTASDGSLIEAQVGQNRNPDGSVQSPRYRGANSDHRPVSVNLRVRAWLPAGKN